MADRDEPFDVELPPLLIVDYQPVPDVRTAVQLIGCDPDGPELRLPSSGVHAGYVYTVEACTWLLTEPDSADTDDPTWERIGVGAAAGALTAARDDALRDLTGFDPSSVQHRLRGSASAFLAAVQSSP